MFSNKKITDKKNVTKNISIKDATKIGSIPFGFDSKDNVFMKAGKIYISKK